MEVVRKENTSVAKKIILFVILSNTIVAFVIMVLSVWSDYKDSKKNFETTFNNIKKSHLSALGSSIYEENQDQSVAILTGIFNTYPDFHSIYLELDDEYIFCSYWNRKSERCLLKQKKRPLKYIVSEDYRIKKLPVLNPEDEEKVGDLTIYASLDKLHRDTRETIVKFGIIMVLQVIFITLLIYFFFKKYVTRHLKKMAIYADSFSLDNLGREDLVLDRVEENSDELEKLVSSFNKMKKNLNSSHEELKDYADNLETKIKEATAEIEEEKNNVSALLDNMKTSVFSIGKDFKIISPVSKYSKDIFKKDIVNQKVKDILYFNLKKGTKEYNDLISVMTSIFGETESQFLALEDNLPRKVTLPDIENERGKTLKLGYSPLLNNEGNVEKLMVMVEDVTESEGSFKDAKNDQVNYHFLREIISIESKEELVKKVELAIQKTFKVLDDFVSPLSDTYDYNHFNDQLKMCYVALQIDLKESPLLKRQVDSSYEAIMYINSEDKTLNFQLKFTSVTCDILDCLLKYQSNLKLVHPGDYKVNTDLVNSILEKVKDIEKIFRNLFEYVFLVREVSNIDKEKLQKVVQVAKLYPEFERTIDLIHQRSKLLSFLFKVAMQEDISMVYDDLSILVKQMPERSSLNESIIKHNLIDPYREVLEQTKDVEKVLTKGFTEKFSA